MSGDGRNPLKNRFHWDLLSTRWLRGQHVRQLYCTYSKVDRAESLASYFQSSYELLRSSPAILPRNKCTVSGSAVHRSL